MGDREKVMHEIERCINTVPYPCEDCSHHGHGDDLVGCMDELLSDAFALLKEQEAEIEKLRRYVNGFSRDAIPVVRCKDCKWNSGTHDFPYCQSQNVPISPDWFCAGGERRQDDG